MNYFDPIVETSPTAGVYHQHAYLDTVPSSPSLLDWSHGAALDGLREFAHLHYPRGPDESQSHYHELTIPRHNLAQLHHHSSSGSDGDGRDYLNVGLQGGDKELPTPDWNQAVIDTTPIVEPLTHFGSTATTPEFEVPPPVTRAKRAQVKNACTNCQKACKKCSNTRPCERCTKNGLTDCVSSTRKPRAKGFKRGPYKRRLHVTAGNSQGTQQQTLPSVSSYLDVPEPPSMSLMHAPMGMMRDQYRQGLTEASVSVGPGLKRRSSLFQQMIQQSNQVLEQGHSLGSHYSPMSTHLVAPHRHEADGGEVPENHFSNLVESDRLFTFQDVSHDTDNDTNREPDNLYHHRVQLPVDLNHSGVVSCPVSPRLSSSDFFVPELPFMGHAVSAPSSPTGLRAFLELDDYPYLKM